MIETGSKVRFARMPEWAWRLPEESHQVFQYCLGRVFRVEAIDEYGHFVLDVSAEIDLRFGGFHNDIRVEGEYLEELK